MRLMLTLGVVLLASCKGEGVGAAVQSSVATCDVAAERLISVCGAFPGEDFRALCELEDMALVTPATRRCAARVSECTEAAYDACDIRSVIIGCDTDQDCPAPYKCDVELEECARCLSDADCAEGRGCLEGLCFDVDSDFYKTFSEVFSKDAAAGGD